MSIYYSGSLRRSAGIVSAIVKEMKSVNLKAVKRVTVTFDPFGENAKSTREFLFHLSTPKIYQTNPSCILKADVVCNRQPPEIKFSLLEPAQEQAKVKSILFKSGNLSTLELLKLCNQHISPLAPKEDLTAPKSLTKSEKQKLHGATKKGGKKK